MFQREDALIGEGESTITRPTQPLGEINRLAKAQKEEASGAPNPMP
jgi:hypothetical protein